MLTIYIAIKVPHSSRSKKNNFAQKSKYTSINLDSGEKQNNSKSINPAYPQRRGTTKALHRNSIEPTDCGKSLSKPSQLPQPQNQIFSFKFHLLTHLPSSTSFYSLYRFLPISMKSIIMPKSKNRLIWFRAEFELQSRFGGPAGEEFLHW